MYVCQHVPACIARKLILTATHHDPKCVHVLAVTSTRAPRCIIGWWHSRWTGGRWWAWPCCRRAQRRLWHFRAKRWTNYTTDTKVRNGEALDGRHRSVTDDTWRNRLPQRSSPVVQFKEMHYRPNGEMLSSAANVHVIAIKIDCCFYGV